MTNDAKIPFLDLVNPHAELQEELVAAFREALKNCGFHRRPNGRGSGARVCCVLRCSLLCGSGQRHRRAQVCTRSRRRSPRANLLSPSPIRSLRRRKPSPKWAPCRSSSTWKSALPPWIPKSFELFLETQCEREPRRGTADFKAHGASSHCHHPGSSVRPSCRHGSDHGAG